MTFEEIDRRLSEARRSDGTYDGHIIAEMNEKGVSFMFTPYGVRWIKNEAHMTSN